MPLPAKNNLSVSVAAMVSFDGIHNRPTISILRTAFHGTTVSHVWFLNFGNHLDGLHIRIVNSTARLAAVASQELWAIVGGSAVRIGQDTFILSLGGFRVKDARISVDGLDYIGRLVLPWYIASVPQPLVPASQTVLFDGHFTNAFVTFRNTHVEFYAGAGENAPSGAGWGILIGSCAINTLQDSKVLASSFQLDHVNVSITMNNVGIGTSTLLVFSKCDNISDTNFTVTSCSLVSNVATVTNWGLTPSVTSQAVAM